MHVPDASEFPGTAENGINVDSQAQWLRALKSTSCNGCHALGNAATRRLEDALGHFDSSVDAWDRRTVMMATHNAEVVTALRKRVVALEEGRIIRDEIGGAYHRED